MKKTLSFILTATTALSLAGWGAISAQAATIYTAAQVAQHNTASDCWLIISGQVYDVTNFIPIHPGGNAIVPYCGTDATAIFDSIHGSTGTAANLLPAYLVGTLGTALSAPTNLSGTPTQTTVALSWTGSTGGVSPIIYAVERNGTSVATTTVTTFTDTGLTASTSYNYIIQATDSSTPTPTTISSSQITVTTLSGSTSTALTAPTNLSGTPTQTTVALSWTGSTGGVSPITYMVLKNGVAAGTTTATTFTSTGLAASTTYTFVVRAVDSSTPTPSSATSSQISVKTLGSVVTGGGGQENENESENENEQEGGHSSTSTPPIIHHGGGDDHTGYTGAGGDNEQENHGGSHLHTTSTQSTVGIDE